MNFLHIPRRARVLVLACGNGIFSEPLTREFDDLTVVDFSSGMLTENRWGERCLGDALKLPFRDGAFDLVFEANLLHHVVDPRAALAEMARVSRRHVALVEPNAWNPLMSAFSAITPVERAGLKFTPAYLRRMVRQAGMTLKDQLCTGMITQNLTPGFLVPILRAFDGRFPLGMYQMLFAETGNRS